jgi:hypothetical protein
MTGSAIDSSSTSYTLAQHSPNNHKQFLLDLTAASMSSDANPFVSDTASPSGSPTNSASPSATPSSGASDSGGVVEVGYSAMMIADYQKAHGIIMGVTAVLLFPLGAIFMRALGGVWTHAAFQIFSLVALIVGFGLGVRLGHITDLVSYSPSNIY